MIIAHESKLRDQGGREEIGELDVKAQIIYEGCELRYGSCRNYIVIGDQRDILTCFVQLFSSYFTHRHNNELINVMKILFY